MGKNDEQSEHVKRGYVLNTEPFQKNKSDTPQYPPRPGQAPDTRSFRDQVVEKNGDSKGRRGR